MSLIHRTAPPPRQAPKIGRHRVHDATPPAARVAAMVQAHQSARATAAILGYGVDHTNGQEADRG